MIKVSHKSMYNEELKNMITEVENLNKYNGDDTDKLLVNQVDDLVSIIDKLCALIKLIDNERLKSRIMIALTLIEGMIHDTTNKMLIDENDKLTKILEDIFNKLTDTKGELEYLKEIEEQNKLFLQALYILNVYEYNNLLSIDVSDEKNYDILDTLIADRIRKKKYIK